MPNWTKRKFWDGTEAVFLKNNGAMSCFDLDSDHLGDIIESKIQGCVSEMDDWIRLKKLRAEYKDGKTSN